MDLYDIPVKTIDGEATTLNRYRGKAMLIVNVASRCGFTPQYAGLEALYRKYKDKEFVVLGFPCDQFGHQEPGGEDEIRTFCDTRYAVSFPLFAKVDVNGTNAHPLYRYLTSARKGFLGRGAIAWNFTKFLVGKNGDVLGRYGSRRTPEEIDKDVAALVSLDRQFGQIDIYLFDQLLRGRIRPGMRVLDAACGGGRNLVYLLQSGFDVFATDADGQAIVAVRRLAAQLAPQLPAGNFRVESVERMSFADAFADVVVSSAVLHFARDDEQFDAMVREMWRVLKPAGMLFCRLASSIGIEDRIRPLGGRQFELPDGSARYLVDEAMLMDLTARLGGRLLDPLKTTVVQNQRCMTTWVVRKV